MGVTAHRQPPPRPFRWSLSRHGGAAEARLGTLTASGGDAPAAPGVPWHLGELTVCTGKVLARSHAADLCFVGRSLDSMYDLLTGALEDAGRPGGLRRLPLSGLRRGLDPHLRRRLREHLAAAGLEPYALARRRRPIALVDVVAGGGTFDTLHTELASWIAESREPWPVIRRKLRYVGVTVRGTTSPHHWRWQQSPESAPWVRTLPAGHVANVSLPGPVWHWYGDYQPKLHGQFHAERWYDEDAGAPRYHKDLPVALGEALALVAAGRTREVRAGLVRTLAAEPAFADREVRALAGALRGH